MARIPLHVVSHLTYKGSRICKHYGFVFGGVWYIISSCEKYDEGIMNGLSAQSQVIDDLRVVCTAGRNYRIDKKKVSYSGHQLSIEGYCKPLGKMSVSIIQKEVGLIETAVVSRIHQLFSLMDYEH